MERRGMTFGTTYLSGVFTTLRLSALCPTPGVLGGAWATAWLSTGEDSNLTHRMAAAATLAATATPPTGAHNREAKGRERGSTDWVTTAGSWEIATLTRRASSASRRGPPSARM